MLLRLALRNFVLIDETEIEFDDGFCAFTGETGAGKSLLVGALSLLAGGRAPAGLIKSGGLAAEIEAFFDLADLPFMSAWLKTHNLDGEDKMLARRIIFDDARKSRAYINGRQVPLVQMAEGVSGMVEICGQHAHYSLLSRRLIGNCWILAPPIKMKSPPCPSRMKSGVVAAKTCKKPKKTPMDWRPSVTLCAPTAKNWRPCAFPPISERLQRPTNKIGKHFRFGRILRRRFGAVGRRRRGE